MTKFYGSLDAQRSPHVVVGFLATALQTSKENLIVQLFPFRSTPLMRQTSLLISQILQPDKIFVASGTPIGEGWPITPVDVDLEPALPREVQSAQRKAQWLTMLDNSEMHTVNLKEIAIEGARLGSGRTMPTEERARVGLGECVHAEKIGSTLFCISDHDPDEDALSKALNETGCTRAHFVTPTTYQGLLCSLVRQNGDDLGCGIIVNIDWKEMRAQVRATAVAPAPARLIRLGSLRIGPQGDEWPEVRPWQI